MKTLNNPSRDELGRERAKSNFAGPRKLGNAQAPRIFVSGACAAAARCTILPNQRSGRGLSVLSAHSAHSAQFAKSALSVASP